MYAARLTMDRNPPANCSALGTSNLLGYVYLLKCSLQLKEPRQLNGFVSSQPEFTPAYWVQRRSNNQFVEPFQAQDFERRVLRLRYL
jgi:hypothetical protein